ncbi:hypothetical protein GGP41_005322 [Bipolaris sorokiniana]|uniref:Uncharacterized protein n=1 Tax=Cochliobolus sativus TaxID=45130 RepID=A0A8H5ZII4_COCSA|nr:hypothetical protein GGP41_005322 [Bipolaris sorokiniana]
MTTTPTGLLKLPLELRQQIYHYVLVPTLQTRTIAISITLRNYSYKLHGLEPIQSLIFTNRLIYHETLHYCFAHFIFHLHNGFYSILDLMSQFYLRIGKRMRKLVRYIVIPRFSVDAVFFRDVYQCTSAKNRPEKYKELVEEMEMAFRMLKRFRELEEVQFGLYFPEVSRDKGIRPWVGRDDGERERERTGTEQVWDSTESLQLQEHGLQQLRAKAAPIRVELVEAPS